MVYIAKIAVLLYLSKNGWGDYKISWCNKMACVWNEFFFEKHHPFIMRFDEDVKC